MSSRSVMFCRLPPSRQPLHAASLRHSRFSWARTERDQEEAAELGGLSASTGRFPGPINAWYRRTGAGCGSAVAWS